MKRLFKFSLIALCLFCLDAGSKAGKTSQLDGHRVVSSSFLGQYVGPYHADVKGLLYPFLEMDVFPNSFVRGNFGYDDDDEDYIEFEGRVDKGGFFFARFGNDGKYYTLLGIITPNTREVTLVIQSAQGNRTVGRVKGHEESGVDSVLGHDGQVL